MRVVMSSSPNWSENFQIFHITYDLLSDFRGRAKWFGAHYNQLLVRFISAGPNFAAIKVEIIIIIIISQSREQGVVTGASHSKGKLDLMSNLT